MDNKCLFDVTSNGFRTSERRLLLDMTAAKDAYKDEEISDIGLVRSGDNSADCLTKQMSQTFLKNTLAGRLDVTLFQWIIRPNSVDHSKSSFPSGRM